jgi:hypothetical protein
MSKMKKMILIAAFVAALFAGANSFAQTPDQAKYLGKWNLTVTGGPIETMTLPMTVTYADGHLGGTIMTTSGETVKFKAVYADKKGLTADFEAEGYDAYISVSLLPDGTLSGSSMGLMSITGTKAEEKRK